MMLKVNFSKLGDALAVNSAGSPIVVVAIPSRNIEPQTIAESINAVVITARIPSESGLSKLEIAVGNEFPEKVNNTKLGLEKLPIAFDARVAAPSLNEFLRREKKSGGGNVSSASSAVENKTEPSPLFTVTNDETRDEIAMFSDLNTLNFNKPVSFKIKAGSDIRVGHFERKFTYLLEKKLLSLGAKEVEEGTSFVREVPAEGDTLEVTLETKRSKLKDRFIINYTIKAVEGSKIQYSYSGSYSITTANGSDGLDYINTIGVKNKIYRLLYVAAGDDLATIVEYLDNFPAINEVWMEDLHFDVNSLASELEIRLKLALNSDQLSKLKDTGKLDIGIFYNGRMIILHFREQDALLKASEGNNADLIIVKLPGSRGTTSEHKDFWPRVLSRAHVGSLICVRLATPPKGLVDYSFWERLGQALRIGSVKKYFKTLIGRKNHGLGDFVLEELRWVQPSYFREITGKNNKVLLLYPKKNNDLLFSILNGLVKDWVVIRVEPESIVNGWSRVSGVGSSALENKIEPSPLVRVNMGMVPFDDGNIGVIGQNFADRAYGGYLDSDTVIAEIREIAARDGLDALRSGTIQKTNKRLYGRGLSQSGGWGDAVIMAGFEYIDGRPGVSISKDEVLDRIRKIASEKGVEELKPEYVQETDEGFKLYSAAMLYFGTWGKAVAAVFDYDQIKKRIEKDVQDASEETGSSSRRVKVDLFSKYPLLSSYQPQDLKSTLQWLNLHREELGGCSFKQLIRVFIEKGRLPEGENAQTWERGASAFVFYLNNRLLQTYQPKDLRTTLYWLEQHRFDLGGNSLNYLVDALSIAGKLPKDVSEETWKFAAGAYDFYLKSNLLKEYQPKEIRRTLNWLYEHRDELGNNSLSYLVFCFSVAGKIPEENERRWGTEAGSFARAIQEKKVILREIKRIWQSGEGWVGFINDISRLRALFNPKLLLNLRTGKPVSYGYRIRILSYAYDLYGKEYIRKIKNKGDGFKFSGSSPVDDSVNSASSGVEKKGGIDFRALPIVTQAVSSLGLNTMSYDLRAKLSQLDVNAELAAINKLLNAGITPSTDRLKACAQAAYLFSQSPEENAKILSCIAQLLRKEESECCDTESVLKDILIVLEDG
ncbi:MAG: hypothetical protein HZC15_01385 [Candidatus Omnitrophica bacterium]|nr:hypothetical protein [Candidatus Omnitrophota bacterium]